MGAFDKIQSGLPGMDRLLNYIRMGDNVVWSVSDLEEFRILSRCPLRRAGDKGWQKPDLHEVCGA